MLEFRTFSNFLFFLSGGEGNPKSVENKKPRFSYKKWGQGVLFHCYTPVKSKKRKNLIIGILGEMKQIN